MLQLSCTSVLLTILLHKESWDWYSICRLEISGNFIFSGGGGGWSGHTSCFGLGSVLAIRSKMSMEREQPMDWTKRRNTSAQDKREDRWVSSGDHPRASPWE